jgi:transposase
VRNVGNGHKAGFSSRTAGSHFCICHSTSCIMKDLTDSKRERIIALHQHTTMTYREIGARLNVSHNGVYETVKRWRLTGSASNNRKGHCGRKKKLTLKEKSLIIRECRRNPTSSAREIGCQTGFLGNRVSLPTIKRVLKAGGLNAYKPIPIPDLTPAKCHVRLSWARCHAFYGSEDWKQVSTVYLFFCVVKLYYSHTFCCR